MNIVLEGTFEEIVNYTKAYRLNGKTTMSHMDPNQCQPSRHDRPYQDRNVYGHDTHGVNMSLQEQCPTDGNQHSSSEDE